MTKKLNTASKLKNIQDSYFVRMMLPEAEKNAELYVAEESAHLILLLSRVAEVNKMNFVVIGAGTLWYIELAFSKVAQYIAVEPLADIFIQKQVSFVLSMHNNIKLIGKELGKFKKSEIPDGNSIFVFHFNILAYITHPIGKINMYLKKGDILYVSTWSDSKRAKLIRKNYFDYLNLHEPDSSFKIEPSANVGLCNLDRFPFDKLDHYTSHERIKGEITDILIIYC